jgi:hypothetical protein
MMSAFLVDGEPANCLGWVTQESVERDAIGATMSHGGSNIVTVVGRPFTDVVVDVGFQNGSEDPLVIWRRCRYRICFAEPDQMV